MDYDEQTTNRYSTTIRFVAIALLLVFLLVVAMLTAKGIVANISGEADQKTATTEGTKDTKKDTDKAENQSDTEKKQQEEQARADAEAKKQEEAKQAAEAAAAAEAANQAASTASNPNHVASTGPIDTAAYTLAFGGLGYGVATYIRSRRQTN